MTDALIRIQQLQALAEMKLNFELARVSEFTQQEHAPKAKLNAINQEEICNRNNGEFEESQAILSGMDVKWQIWAEHEKRTLMRELAQIAQKREDQIIIAKHAFGRTEVLKKIAATTKNNEL